MRTIRTGSLAVVVAGCVLAVAGLAACGGGGGDRVAVEATPKALAAVAERTLEAGTAKLELTIAATTQGRDLKIVATGAFDQKLRRTSLRFDAKDILDQLAATGESIPADTEALFAQPFEVVVDGTTLYLHLPALGPLLGVSTEWVSIEASKAGPAVGSLLGGAGAGTDPGSFLRFLEGARSVTEVGIEDVRGTPATHFTGTFSLADALSAAPDDRRAALQDVVDGLGVPDATLDNPIPFDAWVDDAGHVRRLVLTLDDGRGQGTATMTLEMFDLGQPVDITVPPADQVTDVTDKLAKVGG